jgi:hypothetical protein
MTCRKHQRNHRGHLGHEPLYHGVHRREVTALDLIGLQGMRAQHGPQNFNNVLRELAETTGRG